MQYHFTLFLLLFMKGTGEISLHECGQQARLGVST